MKHVLHLIAWLGVVTAAVGLASCGGGGDSYTPVAQKPECIALVKLDSGPAACTPEN